MLLRSCKLLAENGKNFTSILTGENEIEDIIEYMKDLINQWNSVQDSNYFPKLIFSEDGDDIELSIEQGDEMCEL